MKRLPMGLAGASMVMLSLVAGTALADVPVMPPDDEGCGCRTASQGTNLAALSVLFLGAGVLLSRRSPRGDH